jgi:Domain of unknown function (DU1801)
VVAFHRGVAAPEHFTNDSREISENWYAALQMARPADNKLLNYLAPYDPHVSKLVLAARQVVLEEAPEAIESFFSGYAVTIAFSFTGKPLKDGFCHGVTYTNHVNLGFNRGALLPDPNQVLTGTGKLMRHLPIRSESDLDRPFLRRYIQAAIEQVGGHADVTRTHRTAALRKRKESK